MIELYQLEEEQVAGKRYLTMGFVSVDRRMLSGLPPRAKKIAPLKRSAAQYKETLQRLDEVFEYIESHYQDVLTMEETAKHVGFSPHYFTRFLRRILENIHAVSDGIPDQSSQIHFGKRETSNGRSSGKAGFASVKTFHHVFKETVGQSPLQYQKQLNN